MRELSIAPYETGMGVQLWKSYVDQFSIRLVTPSGEVIGPIDSRLGPQTLRYGGTRILIYYGKPSPFSRAQEVYFDFLPVRDYLDSGIWTFRLTPERIVTGQLRYVAAFQGAFKSVHPLFKAGAGDHPDHSLHCCQCDIRGGLR